MWDPPWPGIEPVSPALAGGFFTTEPPGKPQSITFWNLNTAKAMTYLVAQTLKGLPTTWETWVRSLGWEDLLEKEMATHSSILAWKTPWTKEPGRLQSMGSQSRIRLSGFTFTNHNYCRQQKPKSSETFIFAFRIKNRMKSGKVWRGAQLIDS